MTAIRGSVNVDDFRRLAGKTSQLEPALKRELRASIRLAAEKAADDSRTTIDGGGPSRTGLRLAIASGIKVTVMTGNTAGVKISGGVSQMPEKKRQLVRAFDKPTFRHPVFGQDAWVEQPGRPYFASVIYGHRERVSQAVQEAMQKALDTLK